KWLFFLLVLSFITTEKVLGQTVIIGASVPNTNEAGTVAGELTIRLTGGLPATSYFIGIALNPLSTATSIDDFAVLPNFVPVTTDFTGFGQSIVNVIGVNDNLVESNETVILEIQPGFNYFVGAPNSATVTILDDDTAGFSFIESGGNTETLESGTIDQFNVVLDAQPLTNVVIQVTSLNTAEGIVSPGNLTFTTLNWNIPQTVTVTGQDDIIVDGPQTYNVRLRVTAATSDDAFDPLPNQFVSVTNQDNDTPGVNVSAINGNTTEAGGTAAFNVTLDSEPTAPVTMALTSNNLNEGTVPSSVTIPVANWNTGVVVTITGEDDAVVDGDIPYTIITGNITSLDLNYNALGGGAIPNVQVTNEDDDTFSATVTATDATASEAGGSGEFTINLGAINATGAPITVNFNRSGSTATHNVDYDAIGTSVDIEDGDQTATMEIDPVDDNAVEGQD
ncbi:unnamed protein product, partial [Ectocarpus sp. 12 AP-2014]